MLQEYLEVLGGANEIVLDQEKWKNAAETNEEVDFSFILIGCFCAVIPFLDLRVSKRPQSLRTTRASKALEMEKSDEIHSGERAESTGRVGFEYTVCDMPKKSEINACFQGNLARRKHRKPS